MKSTATTTSVSPTLSYTGVSTGPALGGGALLVGLGGALLFGTRRRHRPTHR